MRAIVPSTTTKWDIFSYFSYLWVTRGWAKKHHPRWYREILEEEKKEAEKKSQK